MDKQHAIEKLREWFATQKTVADGKHPLTIAPVWHSRGSERICHNAWLIAVTDDEHGTRIENITPFVAVVIGEKMDPNTGGIKSPVRWMTTQQSQRLEQELGIELIVEFV